MHFIAQSVHQLAGRLRTCTFFFHCLGKQTEVNAMFLLCFLCLLIEADLHLRTYCKLYGVFDSLSFHPFGMPLPSLNILILKPAKCHFFFSNLCTHFGLRWDSSETITCYNTADSQKLWLNQVRKTVIFIFVSLLKTSKYWQRTVHCSTSLIYQLIYLKSQALLWQKLTLIYIFVNKMGMCPEK